MRKKLFVFDADGKRLHTVTESLAEHWQKHGAKLKGVYIFNDIARYSIAAPAGPRQ